MKPKTWTHPKFTDLQMQLGIGPAYAAGILDGIWHLVATFDPDHGRLPYNAKQLESWLRTGLDPDALMDALVDSGWIDCRDGDRFVHDWEDHKPGYIRETERKRQYRDKARLSRYNPGTSRDNPGTSRDNPGTSRDNPSAADHSDSDSDSDSYKNAPTNVGAAQIESDLHRRDEIVFPIQGGCSFRLDMELFDQYAATYRFDVKAELEKARLWLRDNPDRRPRSKRGGLSFLTRWLNRADDHKAGKQANGKNGSAMSKLEKYLSTE